MQIPPVIRFLSLFVPDLDAARVRYAALLGIEPTEANQACPRHHPFAAAGPVVFDLGALQIALYQCDMRTTHPGDVGIGIVDEAPDALVSRARAAGANVFRAPHALAGEARTLAAFMMPDRHFFEVIGPAAQADQKL